MWAVRAGPAFWEKEKEITPPEMFPMVSQVWSLLGAKRPVNVSVVGRIGSNWSDPAPPLH